jgi:type VI secretion system protein ImpM
VAGFFGKIPSHGDFVTRELPRAFLDVWDRWLQECIAASKSQLGERWLDVYLTSPLWRFALAAGVCGDSAWAGLLMPSVDRVGRYFPLTIATPLEADVNALLVPGRLDAWLDAAEGIALHSLDDDRFDAGAVQAALAAATEPRLDRRRPELTGGIGTAWSLALYGMSSERVAADIAAALVAQQTAQFSLWWTAGTDATALIVAGLPEPQGFADLMRQLRHASDAAPAQAAVASTSTATGPSDLQGAAAV